MIRHAKAMDREEWQKQNKNDEERPLTEEGIEEFIKVAKSIPAVVSHLDAIFTSPCKRTMQTADIVQKSFPEIKVMQTPSLLQGTSWKDVQVFLSKQEWNKDQIIAIVGHENHLSHILGSLISCTGEENIRFKKGGIALVDLGMMEAKVSGKLVWFLPPKVVMKLVK